MLEEVQEVDDTHSEEDEGSSEDEDNTVNREKQVLYSHLEDIKKCYEHFIRNNTSFILKKKVYI